MSSRLGHCGLYVALRHRPFIDHDVRREKERARERERERDSERATCLVSICAALFLI